jgi:hypothetical protein
MAAGADYFAPAALRLPDDDCCAIDPPNALRAARRKTGIDIPERQNPTRPTTESEPDKNNFTATLIHSCCSQRQRPALGQISISRVGQYSISADSRRRKAFDAWWRKSMT